MDKSLCYQFEIDKISEKDYRECDDYECDDYEMEGYICILFKTRFFYNT